MTHELLTWDVYDIGHVDESLIGISLRGRLRKHAVREGLNLLVDNATHAENCVRFAVLADESIAAQQGFVEQAVPGATIERRLQGVVNPVLSKLSIVTNEAKY
ncbi:MAG TPA: hypothetical protein VLF40_05675 [Candidatus Saccharimonadales bacterium]|nr:hypothetical protein [Candidatus Saccharimonadales bacterium]